jgi:ankyrin repeat protein
LKGNRSLAESVNSLGYSVIHLAAQQGRPELIESLVAHGIRPDTPNSRNGETALHCAAVGDQAAAAATLIRLGANVGNQDRSGMSALHVAAMRGSVRVADVLLKASADPNATLPGAIGRPYPAYLGPPTLAGNTPLHVAALFGQTNVISLLLKSGASVHATNAMRQTPLDLASVVDLRLHSELSRLQSTHLLMQNATSRAPALTSPASLRGPQRAAAVLLEQAGARRSARSGW